MICLMEKEWNLMLMAQPTKANSSTAKNTTKTVPTVGQTTKSTPANSKTATCKATENYSCQTQQITVNIKVNFPII